MTLRVAHSSAPIVAACASISGRSAGSTPTPTPITTSALASRSRSSSRRRSRTRARDPGPASRRSTANGAVGRGRSPGRIPGRTVAICTGDVQEISATSRPPNAGLNATRRPSRASSPIASPVRPAPSRAASRAAASRPHAVPGASTAHGDSRAKYPASILAMSSAPVVPACLMTLSAPWLLSASQSSTTSTDRTARPPMEAARPAAAPSSSAVTRWRPGSPSTTTSPPAPSPAGRATSSAGPSTLVSKVPRYLSTSTTLSTWSGPTPSRRSPARSTSSTRMRPTVVGLPSAPHGPWPSAAASTTSMCAGSTVAQASGSLTLHGSQSRSAHDTTAGRSTSARTHSSSCSSQACTVSPSTSSSRAPVRRGSCSSSATWAGTWPVSASTELRPQSTRSHGPPRSSAAASARAVARVSLPANAGSDTCRPPVQPHRIASRSTVSADGGPSVMAVHDPPDASARSHPARTPRRQ